jgi:hypothetical protein
MTRTEAAKLVLSLFNSFPSARVSEGNAEAYESALLDLDARVAHEAVTRLRNTRTFLPSISEIRSAAADVTLGPARSGEEAYAILLRAVRQCGWISPPRFLDPNITRALGVWGSWMDVCVSPGDDAAGRARFIELYEQSAQSERADVVAGKPLPRPRAGNREFGPAPAARVERSTVETVSTALEVQPAAPRVRPVSPMAGRKLSAADIDAALEGGQ